jgi:hypothetical protein
MHHRSRMAAREGRRGFRWGFLFHPIAHFLVTCEPNRSSGARARRVISPSANAALNALSHLVCRYALDSGVDGLLARSNERIARPTGTGHSARATELHSSEPLAASCGRWNVSIRRCVVKHASFFG